MFQQVVDILYPKYCTVCHRYGNYLCDTCKKSFKCNLPECYVCRRLSPGYATHEKCKNTFSLNRIFVAWEYNVSSSKILKLYKYKNIKDVYQQLSNLLIERILANGYNRYLGETLFIPVPISSVRTRERGFNQSELITSIVARRFNNEMNTLLIGCKNTHVHRARQNVVQRYQYHENPFYIAKDTDISRYSSITILDDVITTGVTLENVTRLLRHTYGSNLHVNAICLFRGRPNYLYSADNLFSSSTIV